MKNESAYAYLRVSGQGQVSGNSFHRQLKEIRRYCQVAGYRIIKTYKEQVSGTSDEDSRPEMSKMIADLLSNGCNTVII